jgi:aquaporin rerated protein, other eukaryote
LNFARSLGPAVINRHFPGYFWIYFVGPILGSLLATGFYVLISILEYENWNPGQDSDALEAQTDRRRSDLMGKRRGPENGMEASGSAAVEGPATNGTNDQI